MTKTDKTIKNLVIARALSMPDNIGISIGQEGEFTKNEIIKHIEKNDKVGKKFIKIQLEYLRSLKNLTNELLK